MGDLLAGLLGQSWPVETSGLYSRQVVRNKVATGCRLVTGLVLKVIPEELNGSAREAVGAAGVLEAKNWDGWALEVIMLPGLEFD